MRFLLLSAAALLVLASCKPSEKNTKGNAKAGTSISVVVPQSFVPDTLQLLAWEGIQVKPVAIATAPTVANNLKTFEFPKNSYPAGFYYIGAGLNDAKAVMIGVDKQISISLDTSAQHNKFATALVTKGANNLILNQTIDSLNIHGQLFSDLIAIYPTAQQSPIELQKINAELKALDTRRQNLLQNLRKTAPNVANIAALYTYLSYPNNRKSETQLELDYFANNFFQFVDFKDTSYYRLPHFFESIKNYATNLGQLNMSIPDQQRVLDTLLARIPQNSPQHMPALLAVAFSYVGRHNGTFYKYGTAYTKRYTGREPMVDQFLAKQLPSAVEPLMVGTEAPDFTEMTPEGKPLKLSELRGKVVLIDFWASWCGPCRRENPNVVKAYERFKDKGFEILSVSLDTDRNKWLGAIEADKMTWKHVSDLKGWSASAGKLYGVSGIPFTVLLDKQGRIIAKNLRGPALEEELAKILGK